MTFQAMNCPCEILLDRSDAETVSQALALARAEAERIERCFSRYRDDNLMHAINSAQGGAITVDDEMAALLDLAEEAYLQSDGLFDITTGALRRVWHFTGESVAPSEDELRAVRGCIGWNRVQWRRPQLVMPAGFEIDLGGIAKEYAADRISDLIRRQLGVSALVNLGGDIAAGGEREWSVGLEDPHRAGRVRDILGLRRGGVATSGTTRRFAHVHGKRRGHILDPRSGEPVLNAPLSVTVVADTCVEAGLWSTIAMLQGDRAESFLSAQGVEFRCYRD